MRRYRTGVAMLLALVVCAPQASGQEAGHLLELIMPRPGSIGARMSRHDQDDALAAAVERLKAPKKKLCIVDGHPKTVRPSQQCPTAPDGAAAIE